MNLEYPEIYEESLKKNEGLDKHLRDIYVKSHDPDVSINFYKYLAHQNFAFQIKDIEPNPDRPLPTCRSIVEDFEYGHKEPENVPFGKITIKNAMYFIGQHQMDPKKYNSTTIAEKYKLSEEAVCKYQHPHVFFCDTHISILFRVTLKVFLVKTYFVVKQLF